DASRVRDAVATTPHDDEGLLVLRAHGVEEFGAVGAARLPVREHHGDGVGFFLCRLHAARQPATHRPFGRSVLDREHVAGVVPRGSGYERCRPLRRAWRHEATEPSHQADNTSMETRRITMRGRAIAVTRDGDDLVTDD